MYTNIGVRLQQEQLDNTFYYPYRMEYFIWKGPAMIIWSICLSISWLTKIVVVILIIKGIVQMPLLDGAVPVFKHPLNKNSFLMQGSVS